MDELVGKWIKINRGGPDSIEGKVLAVKDDVMTLLSNNGIVFVSTRHIKSLSELGGSKTQGNRTDGNRTEGNKSRTKGHVHGPSNFYDAIRSFNQKFVQINGGGPEMVTGFIAEISDDSIKLIHNREVLSIPLYHIKSIRAEASNTNKSGGNKSSNNKTSGNKKNKNKNKQKPSPKK